MFPYDLLAAMLLAYLFGSISSAVLVCRLMGLPDPRKQGSKNPGATNVLRLGGKKAAALTLLGDMLKGVIPVLAAQYYDGFSNLALSLIALSAFIGHLYPIFFGFQGGKGVATLLGVSLALHWSLGLSLIATWLLVALCFRYSSLAALLMSIAAPFYGWYFLDGASACVIAVMALLLIVRHRENIRKLLQGKENKIGTKKR